MDTLLALETPAPPRLARAVGLQTLALAGLAVVAALPWPRARTVPVSPPPEVKKEERRIRIVQLPRPAPRSPPAASPPRPQPASPARAQPSPAPPAVQAAAARAPSPASLARIAADSTAVRGVR